MEQKETKKRGRGRVIAAVLAAIVLVLCALGILLYRDRLTPDRLREVFGGNETRTEDTEPFAYEVGSGQAFAVSGNCLAVASTTGIQLLDDKGQTLTHEVLSMERPAVTASSTRCVFYDAGGTEMRVTDAEGTVQSVQVSGKILSARLNEENILTVITEETGYKAVVTVYNSELQRIFAWHSGTAYVFGAEVSPNGKNLAAVCASAEGGSLKLFSLSSEEPLGEYTAAGELFWDLRWSAKDQICILSDSCMLFLNTKAEVKNEYDFAGRYLLDYDLGSSFAAILLGDHRAAAGGWLYLVGEDGRELACREIEKDVVSMSAGNGKLLLLCGDSLELCTDALLTLNSTDKVQGVKKALLRRDGKCLLLSAYGAELAELY